MKVMQRNNPMFSSLLDELFRPETNAVSPQLSMPQVNVKETDAAFTLELIAPGRNKEDFTLAIENDLLTVVSEVTSQTQESNEKYTRKEFVASSFKRSFNLPETVNEEAISASYVNGVLQIELPKKPVEMPKAKKQIVIG